jgi:hypothetical protein
MFSWSHIFRNLISRVEIFFIVSSLSLSLNFLIATMYFGYLCPKGKNRVKGTYLIVFFVLGLQNYSIGADADDSKDFKFSHFCSYNVLRLY